MPPVGNLREANGVAWIVPPPDVPSGVNGGVSTRLGGVSLGPMAALNLGRRAGDPEPCVDENFRRLSAAAGVALERAARIRLVHGTRVVESDHPGPLGEADGLWTRVPGLPLALTVADCLPLLLADDRGGVALVHCGWRSLAGGIAAAAATALAGGDPARAARCWAWIGPGIGPCCFAVGPDVAERFPPEVRRPPAVSGAPGRVDLFASARTQLLAVGLVPARVHAEPVCTSCHPRLFYSHRRDRGTTGRMLAWIVVS